MKYWNIELDLIEGPEVVTASTQAFGAWARIIVYCARIENSGLLRGAAQWQDRQWTATCRVGKSDVDAAVEAGLILVKGEDVEARFYPFEREQSEIARRAESVKGGQSTSPAKAAAARSNGSLGGRPRAAFPLTQDNPPNKPTETHGNPPNKPTAPVSTYEKGPETQRKGKEGKGKERNTYKGQHLLPGMSAKAESIKIPANWSPQMETAWTEWQKHRAAAGKPLTAQSAKLQQAMIETWGEAKAVINIERSINAGWQGLFDPP